MDENSKIVLLGTGTPNADPERSGPSVAIISGGMPYIVDFGPGIVRRTQSAYKNGCPELNIGNLTRAFVTHLHSDHTAGYPDLIFTPWVLGRSEPLLVFGPAGLKLMTDKILQAYSEDIRERLHGLQPSNNAGYMVIPHEIRSGKIYRDKNVMVEAHRARHGSMTALSFKFHTVDRVITISGDTSPTDDLIVFFRGSDVLVHEVYSSKGFENYSPDWQAYHRSVHTSSAELAQIASIVKPKLLVMYHQLFNGVTDRQLLSEVRSGYDGEVVSANDLDVF